jgi:Fe-S oxidoreductase
MKLNLDWSAYRDAGLGDAYADVPKQGDNFGRAVAVCINSGQCEQQRKGVMCPSFRVSDNPRWSPGGRVKMLKQALNSGDLQSALLDPDLKHSMDLCLACKGCKRECENNIDMAMIKSEYLAQVFALKGTPLRSRLLASLPLWLHSLPGIGIMLNWRNRSPLLARLAQALFGISSNRRLPQPLSSGKTRFTSHNEACDKARAEVVLLVDTFSRHFTPGAIEAAIGVLQHGGYRVITTDMAQAETTSKQDSSPLCCGRSYIAHGLIEQARDQAQRMLQVLLPQVEAGRKVIGLEPACLLAIRDDYRFLGLGEAADKVAAQALLFEEFITREVSAGRLELEFAENTSPEQSVLVHGHCHQKAVGAMKSMRKLLKMIPGIEFEFIEASCCGMAGSFGIEQEHAEFSLQMAEQDLFPRLRAQPDALVVANGFSCRHQISDGLDRDSIHVAELLHNALRPINISAEHC